MYRRKAPSITVPNTEGQTSPFSLTSSGTFKEGDLNISRHGLVINSNSPRVFPSRYIIEKSYSAEEEDDDFCMDVPQEDTVILGDKISPTHSVSTIATGATGLVRPASQGVTPIGNGTGGDEIKLDDLQILGLVGRGSGGVVQKVLHRPSGKIFALKVIPLDVTDSVRKGILLELRTLYEAQSKRIVHYHGAFFSEGSIFIALEFMEGGSLADLLKRHGAFPEPFLANIARQVLEGLNYLHKDRHLIHRDIKPSNLLVNYSGEVKISDFGVSGQLANTISSCASWVGTVTYMSPERIQGHSYSMKSDIWSFGLSITELALGEFPYPMSKASVDQQSVGFWDLLDFIVEQPSPRLPQDQFSAELCDFCACMLAKDPTKRVSSAQLLHHPFIERYKRHSVEWEPIINNM